MFRMQFKPRNLITRKLFLLESNSEKKREFDRALVAHRLFFTACRDRNPKLGFLPSSPCVCAYRWRPGQALLLPRMDFREESANGRRRTEGKPVHQCYYVSQRWILLSEQEVLIPAHWKCRTLLTYRKIHWQANMPWRRTWEYRQPGTLRKRVHDDDWAHHRYHRRPKKHLG